MFIILIVSCTDIIVAPDNFGAISSVGMKVYNIPLKFKEIAHTSHEILHFKIMIHFVLWRTTLSSTIQNAWENHEF